MPKQPAKKGGGGSASSSAGAGGGTVRDGIREGICATCFAKAEKRCEKCKQIWFCSATCLQKGWLLGHRGDCGLTLGKVQVPELPPEYCISTVEKPVFSDHAWHRLADTDAKAERPKGFMNMGNTCYLSAALQCLAAMPAFNAYCEEHAVSCQELKKDEDGASAARPAWGGAGGASSQSSDALRCFRCDLAGAFAQCRVSLEDGALRSEGELELSEGDWVQLHGLASADFNGLEGVIMCMPSAEDVDGRVAVRLAGTSVAKGVQPEHLRRCQPPCPPRELARWLPRLGESFTFGAQEDAHEFCRSVLRMLGDEQLQEHHRGVAERPVGALAMAEEFTAIPSRVFGGVLVTQCCCTESGCGHSTHRFEPFQDLSLEINEVTDTIEEMLQLFTSPERLDKDNRWICDPESGGCGKKVRARKRLMIYQAPQCLVLQLKRFRMGLFGKVNKAISFSVKLNLRPFLASSAVDDRPEYDLMGVLVHLDKRNISHYGHYVAYVKCPKKGEPGVWQWFLLDDDRSQLVPEAEVLRQTAYLLFYTRSPTARKAPGPPALQRAVSGGAGGGPAEVPGPGELRRGVSGDAGGPSSQACLRRCAAEKGCSFFAAQGQDLCSQCYRDAFGKAPPPPPKDEEASPASPPPAPSPVTSAAAEAPRPKVVAGKAGGDEKKKGKIGANEQCPCGSGKKYKKCHGAA